MAKLDEMLTRLFNTKTRSVENPVIANTGGVAAALLLRNNPDRLAFTIVNLSANAMYLGLTDLVSAVNGIFIGANGGSVVFTYQDDFQMVGWAWWVISPAGASAVYSLEVIGG